MIKGDDFNVKTLALACLRIRTPSLTRSINRSTGRAGVSTDIYTDSSQPTEELVSQVSVPPFGLFILVHVMRRPLMTVSCHQQLVENPAALQAAEKALAKAEAEVSSWS
jgi:hypothetical protein